MRQTVLQTLQFARADAEWFARRLGMSFVQIELHRVTDEELQITVGPAAPITVIYAPLDRPNEKLIALLFAAEALRCGGARRLVLVVPYLCSMPQDIAFRGDEAVSQKVVGNLLAATVGRVVTIDAHLHRTTSPKSIFFGIESDNLSPAPAIAAILREAGFDGKTIVVGPEAESQPRVRALTGCLGFNHTVARRARRNDRSVVIEFPDRALLAGQPALLIDDIVSSGGALMACANALTAAGAAVDAVITHALFPPEQMKQFARAGIRSLRSTVSVPHPTDTIPLDELFATALKQEIQAVAEREP